MATEPALDDQVGSQAIRAEYDELRRQSAIYKNPPAGGGLVGGGTNPCGYQYPVVPPEAPAGDAFAVHSEGHEHGSHRC